VTHHKTMTLELLARQNTYGFHVCVLSHCNIKEGMRAKSAI
jgi:hypothetical protein